MRILAGVPLRTAKQRPYRARRSKNTRALSFRLKGSWSDLGLIYLDNAATSFPKPRCVYEAAIRCIERDCGNAGRGSHPLALASAKRIYDCREAICRHFDADDPLRVVFTLNTTYALNFLLKGILKQGDHVLISDMEHNAVLRPLQRLAADGRITYDTFPTMSDSGAYPPLRLCGRIAELCRPNTRAIVCSHQSNLCSATLPLKEIGEFCHRHGLLFLVDVAQSAGHLPITLRKNHIDALCAPGHKGLLGLQGCGFCLLGERIHPDTLIEGGSGYQSLSPDMPDEYPERGEAGTLPTPAITSLAAGIGAIERLGIEAIGAHEQALFRALHERLESLEGYRIYLPQISGSTLLLSRQGILADRIGAYLGDRGICVRSGYHCAALGHGTLQTPEGGAVRVSFGPFNTLGNVEALFSTLRRMEFLHEVE